MTTEEMYDALEQGKKIRRPSWHPTAFMILDNGIEQTWINGKIVALGLRILHNDPTDWEIILES